MNAQSGKKPGSLMAAEIVDQPMTLARQLERMGEPIREVAQRLRSGHHRYVVLAGRGTSDHAALYGKYVIETLLGLPAGLASPSSLTAYRAPAHFEGVLWIVVSQSGASPDLTESTLAAARGGATTLAITNAPESPLAAAADLHIDIAAGPEQSVAATKTYTAQLQALWLLVNGWAERDHRRAGVVAEAVHDMLHQPEVPALAARYRFAERLVTTGRGFSYPTALEAALKLMETSYVHAHAFSGADLLHGPLAMVDESGPVIVVAPQGVGGDLLRPVLKRLRERRVDVCLLGDRELGTEAAAATVIGLPDGLDETLSPIVQIVPLQQLALQLALNRQQDPDEPRGLRKVTETR